MIVITFTQQLPHFELSLRRDLPASFAIHVCTTLRARATFIAKLNRALGGASHVRVPLHFRRRRRDGGGDTRDRACSEIFVVSLPLLYHRPSLYRLSAVRAEDSSTQGVALLLWFDAAFTAVLVHVFLGVWSSASDDAHAIIALNGAIRRQIRVNAGIPYRTKWWTKTWRDQEVKARTRTKNVIPPERSTAVLGLEG